MKYREKIAKVGEQDKQDRQVERVAQADDEQETQVDEEDTQVDGQVAEVEPAEVKPKGSQGEGAADKQCRAHYEAWMRDHLPTWEAGKLPAALEPYKDICYYTKDGDRSGMRFSSAKLETALVSSLSAHINGPATCDKLWRVTAESTGAQYWWQGQS